MGDALMAEPQTYADAEVFDPAHSLVYGPGSAYSGQQPTPEQYKYAYESATTRDKRAPEGSAVNPTYDTPDATGKGLYHVNPQGQLVDEHPQVNLAPGKSVMSDADVFGTHTDPNFDPAKTYDTRPTDQVLGAKEGTYTVGKNLADALSMRLPGMKANPAAGVMYLPQIATDVASAIMRHGLDAEGKTARPGLAGRIGAEAALTLPLAFTGEGAPLLIGAAQGDLTSESQDPLTRLRDIGIGAVGGKAGDLVAGGVKGALWPTLRPEAQWAVDNDIRLTPGGYAGSAKKGTSWGVAKNLETGLANGTLVGPMIGGAQRQGIEDFNLATAKHVLDGTGLILPDGIAPGHDAVNATSKLLGGAFNSLAPKLSLTRDAELGAAIGDAASAGKLMEPAFRNRMSALIGQLPAEGEALTGETVKTLTSQLRKDAAKAAKSGEFFSQDYGDAVGALSTAVDDALERSNPAQAAQLQALRSAWAKQIRVEKAAVNAVQDDGIYTPKGLLTAVKAADQSARDNATARGVALMQDWAKSGKAVLPDTLPGSRSNSLIDLMKTGVMHGPELGVAVGVGHESGVKGIAGMLAAEGGMGLLYTKPAQDIIRTILTKRPGGAKTAADLVQKLAPLATTAGAATAQNAVWPSLQPLVNGNRP